MESPIDGAKTKHKAQNKAFSAGSVASSISESPQSSWPPSPKQSRMEAASLNHVTNQNGSVIDHKHEEVPSLAKQFYGSSKETSEFTGLKDVSGKKAEMSLKLQAEEPKSGIKHSIDDSEDLGSSGLVESDKGPSKGSDVQLKNPQNSVCSTTLYKEEANESFTNTEVSECVSSVEKSGECAEISNSGDLIESRKTSICRGSTGSDVSDESSSSTFSSNMYKPHKANDTRWEAIQAVRNHEGALGLHQFKLLRRLGCGDIGSVYLSELTGTRSYFAMKVMDKVALASRKKLLRSQTEREILQSLDHPFLPTLYTHFETEKFSCLVMEFCPGGDLHALRQRQPGKYFPEQAARFYVAEVLLAMEYLHMLGIIYRDLKPENVLVREDGHIMLSDFDLSLRCAVSPTLVKSANTNLGSQSSGYCAQPACIQPSCVIEPSCIQPGCFAPRFFSSKPKKGKSKKPNKPKNDVHHQVTPLPELVAEPTSARSMSFVGTHEYLAPEIVKGEGHGSAVDWWTFGIFLYELLYGKTPFKGAGNRATLFNVVGQPLKFPDSPTVSFAARDLIRGLLVKEPQHRLAYRRGATEIKQHPFFQSVNWALIRCTSPPDVPKPVAMEVPARPDAARVKAAAGEKVVPGVDVKGSGNYLEIDFF